VLRYLKSSFDIISTFRHGLLHVDKVIGNACARGLSSALYYGRREGGTYDVQTLNGHLYRGTAQSWRRLCDGLKRFGNGDHTDATRVSPLVQTTSVILAAATFQISLSDDKDDGVSQTTSESNIGSSDDFNV